MEIIQNGEDSEKDPYSLKIKINDKKEFVQQMRSR